MWDSCLNEDDNYMLYAHDKVRLCLGVVLKSTFTPLHQLTNCILHLAFVQEIKTLLHLEEMYNTCKCYKETRSLKVVFFPAVN